ncbi:DUF998 domain-containing protein [Allobranchiibius sp. GilTou38]|uniref:DUF998 domain-containing protein n=1 Tax=Allobranchiibius sp. GilTou38 TaxID=2815210 RepID=UPI001AA158A2|nr:DUF998 domain-containing protein [Allobranchiibius sp. GilTou38]MBO1767174.1 DUF998 domain-containing protein [Allobranchiibius sp. GilTou38]
MTRRTVAWPLALVAAVLYSSFLLSYVVRRGQHADFVSQLELPGAPYADWYRASDVLAGLALLAIAWLCWPDRHVRTAVRWACVMVAVVGAGSLLDGSTSMDCASGTGTTCDLGDHSVPGLLHQLIVGHTLSGLAGFAAAGIGAACCARASHPAHPGWMRVHIVLAAGIGLCGLADLALLLVNIDMGLVERLRILLVSAWIASVPWTVRAVRHDAWARSTHDADTRAVRS